MKEQAQTIILFAGTSEGRRLALHCAAEGRQVIACVATEYGEQMLPDDPDIRVHCGRMDEQEMQDFFSQELRLHGTDSLLVIDATHPYAVLVSQTLRSVCEKRRIRYVRLLREQSTGLTENKSVHIVDDMASAAELAQQMSGNIFLTTGSKELSVFAQALSDRSRLYVRILPSIESMELCERAGLGGKQLICMQGPFSEALNQAMYEHVDARILVTKESGQPGGFADKLQAALARGMECIVIRRPGECGLSYEQVCGLIGLREPFAAEREHLLSSAQVQEKEKKLYLVGIGMGTRVQMTQEAIGILSDAPVIFGAKRMLDAVHFTQAKKVCSYRKEEILAYLEAHPQVERAAVVFSGDVGFYSGADGFGQQFVCGESRWQTVRIAGLSSVNYFAAKLGVAWQDAKLCSVHGRQTDLIGQIRREEKVFSLLGGAKQLEEIAQLMCELGMSQVRLSVGCDLGYEMEQIWKGSAQQFLQQDEPIKNSSLCVVLFENEQAENGTTGSLPDTSYERGRVPLTKEEIRILALAKLRLTRDAICYDIGAGTGGMTCDIAEYVPQGRVIAFERGEEGCALIRSNVHSHGLCNVDIVHGTAPECLEGYDRPTHAFIGGTGGRLREIVSYLLEKNPDIRIVIDAVTLETVSEATELLQTLPVKDAEVVCASVAKAHVLGGYHLMEGMNPVYIFSFTGAAYEKN